MKKLKKIIEIQVVGEGEGELISVWRRHMMKQKGQNVQKGTHDLIIYLSFIQFFFMCVGISSRPKTMTKIKEEIIQFTHNF